MTHDETHDETRRRREAFARLHDEGTFVLPNAWDAGSARLLAHLGFPAIATTSSGHAATLGRNDQRVTRDELLAHAAELVTAVDVPVNVDAERCFAEDPEGVAATVELIAATGASGCSIEDYDPRTGRIDDLGLAAERVAAAASVARRHGLVLTARAENHLYEVDDVDDTLSRLRAYREAGADVLYAPGPTSGEVIRRLVTETAGPVNVLARPGGPTVSALAELGVRRVSTGGALAFAAYDALVDAAQRLLEIGTVPDRGLSPQLRGAAFD